MIVSDDKCFVFVHIPKCGGTSARKLLMPFKTPQKGLGGAVGDHMPLYKLESLYPSLWAKMLRYKSFSFIRKPEARFYSCVMQRLIDFGGVMRPTAAEYRRACAADAAFLSAHPDSRDWPDEYVHFTPQVDYIFRGDTQIVDRLFLLERPQEFLCYLSSEFDIRAPENLERTRGSASVRHQMLRVPAEVAAKALRPILSASWAEGVKASLRRVVYSDFSAERVLGVEHYGSYSAFVRAFYAADVRLWGEVMQRSRDKDTRA